MAYYLGFVTGLILFPAIGLFVLAMFVRLGCKWVVGIRLNWGTALVAAFVSVLVFLVSNFAVVFLVVMLRFANPEDFMLPPIVFSTPVSLGLQSLAFGVILKDEGNEPIGTKSAFLVSLVQIVLGLITFFVITGYIEFIAVEHPPRG